MTRCRRCTAASSTRPDDSFEGRQTRERCVRVRAVERPKNLAFMVGWLVFLGIYQIFLAWKFGTFFEGTHGDLRHYFGGAVLEPLYAVIGVTALVVAWGGWHLRPWAYTASFILQGLIYLLILGGIIFRLAWEARPHRVAAARRGFWRLQPVVADPARYAAGLPPEAVNVRAKGPAMTHMVSLVILATSVNWWSGWNWHGSFTTLDLIAATTNALNGALLARRPDHYKNFTIVGVILMALLMGLGGGITRDVLVNQIPSALTNPAYILLCLAAGFIGYKLAFAGGQLFREGLFQFMTSFSLPLYAIVGAQKGVSVGLPVLGVLALGVIGPTAGRWYVDVSCGVPPKHFIRGEWFVGIAL